MTTKAHPQGKTKVFLNLVGTDSSAFSVMGIFSREAKSQGFNQEMQNKKEPLKKSKKMHKREVTLTIQADFYEENPSQKELQDFVSALNNAIDEASLTSEPQILPDSIELVPLPPELNRDYMIGYIGRFVRNNGGDLTSKEMQLDISPCLMSKGQVQQIIDTIYPDSVEVTTLIGGREEAIDDMEWSELPDDIVEEIYENIREYEENLDVQQHKDEKNGLL